MPPFSIQLRGDGIALRSAARLLDPAQFHVFASPTQPRTRVPTIMIGATTQRIFTDIFNTPNLFADTHPIEARIVRWGAGTEAKIIPHSAVAASEALLLSRLDTWPVNTTHPDFTIQSTTPANSQIHSFGNRLAHVAQVNIAPSAANRCFVESLTAGWLFLVADSASTGWLLSGGMPLTEALAASHLIAPVVLAIQEPQSTFPAHPRITLPLTQDHSLSCGAAAIAFDPLCGDGSGYALREGILAAAVLRAIAAGQPPPALLHHYEHRLLAGLERHLQVCTEFYSTGGGGAWWRDQLKEIQNGLAWCQSQLQIYPAFRFALQDFSLIEC